MRIIFFGTPSFAAHILTHLNDKSLTPVAIVTRPDRPQGRSLQMMPSPVKQVAEVICPTVPLFQPEKASTEAFCATLREFDADLFLVVAYGEILRK